MNIFLFVESPWGILFSFLGKILWIILGGIIVWVRSNVYAYMILKRKIVFFFIRKKYILLWNDDSKETSERIITQLKNKKNGKFIYKILKTPSSILYYPEFFKYVHTIILIVTDVTKLDENTKKKTEIENKLLRYVNNGGTLIGTHDIIYRRCRNEKLQKAFGCTIKKFQPIQSGIKVNVVKAYRGHPLLKNIQDNLYFSDNEIITGDWDCNIDKLIVTSENNHFKDEIQHVPMLCVNSKTYTGLLIWISCGDKGDQVCDSIKIPQPYFIQILSNAIKNTKQIKAYS